MTPALATQAVHLPFDAGPFRMAMGLIARPPGEMIVLDDQYLPTMAERRRLIADIPDEVLGCIPGAEPACAALLRHLGDLLPTRFPEIFTRDGARLHNCLTAEDWSLDDPAPLRVVGHLVPEDICLLQITPQGPVLAAAVLCFPSRWRLLDKLGLPLADVHAPTPFYAERLAAPVDRFISHLRPGRLVERLNWSLFDSPGLHQSAEHGVTRANPDITPANAGAMLFLRVERQTLSLLPGSDHVAFTIRIYHYPLSRIAADPALARELAGAVRALPSEMEVYKSLRPYRTALLAYLDCQGGPCVW